MIDTNFELTKGRDLAGTPFREASFRAEDHDVPQRSVRVLDGGTVTISNGRDGVSFTPREWSQLLAVLFPAAASSNASSDATAALGIDALPDMAASAVGVTPTSDIRSFVVQAVRWALREVDAVNASPRPMTLNPSSIADAIEKCDWSGCSIGNKEILRSAVVALRSSPDTALPSDAIDPGEPSGDHIATLLINKSTILDALADARITHVVLGFNEEDFATEVEFIVARTEEAICTLPQTMIRFARCGRRQDPVSLTAALTIILDDLLGADRAHEAGAEGTLRIDVVARTIVVKGLRREVVHHPFKRVV